MAKGGKRPGAGRKKGFNALEAEAARKLLIKRVTEKWEPLLESQLALALGVFVEEFDLVTGKPRVYQKPPERAAIEYLVNQVIGRPKETHELGTKDDKPLPIQIIDFTTYKPKVITD